MLLHLLHFCLIWFLEFLFFFRLWLNFELKKFFNEVMIFELVKFLDNGTDALEKVRVIVMRGILDLLLWVLV